MPPMNTKQLLEQVAFTQAKLTGLSLGSKIQQLRSSRSPDRLQQLQTEAIVELYDVVKQIQESLTPLIGLIPDVGAVREAAAASGPVNPTLAPHIKLTR